VLDGEGRLIRHRLGNALEHADAVFQAVVPAGCWFAAQRAAAELTGFALVGCTVAPGFEFEAFELADAAALTAAYPQHAAVLAQLAPRSA
jgi:predicted cupin superfamily sugar epimerase